MSSIGGGMPPEGDEEALARRIAEGDETAFAQLYHQYFARAYDFVLRLSRDKEIAALAVQVAFLRALAAAQAGEPAPFKLQLFAAARIDAGERLRARRGPPPEEDESFAVLDASRLAAPAVDLADVGIVVWQICRDTKPEEYELLDLGYRQQFDPGELASALRTRVETVEGRLARLRGGFESTFSSLLLLRRGRRACLDLDMLIGDGGWSPSVRRSIQRHLQSCQTCQATRRRFPSALELFAALTLLLAPAGWEDTILERLREAARVGNVPAGPAPAAPLPAALPPSERRPVDLAGQPSFGLPGQGMSDMLGGLFSGGSSRGPLLLALGGGLLFIVILMTALCTTGAFNGSSGLNDTPTPTRTSTRLPTRTATITPTSTETPVAEIPTAVPTDTPPAEDTPTDTPAPFGDTPTSEPATATSSTPVTPEP